MKNLLCYLSSDMEKHTDKHNCEFSVTLTLRRELNEEIWPFYLDPYHEGDSLTFGGRKVDLDVGDGLIYKGVETPHWRDKFEGSKLAQVFLHYVRR